MNTPIIITKSLSKIYHMGGSTVYALDDVDLSVNKGEFLALVGSWFMPHQILSAQSYLRVTYLDVGQGNSAVAHFI